MTDFGSASSSPSGNCRVSTVLAPPLSACEKSRAGNDRCRGSVPCPYRTAGILPARRVRRAPPLPNSVRISASKRTSDTADSSKAAIDELLIDCGDQTGAVDVIAPAHDTEAANTHRADHGRPADRGHCRSPSPRQPRHLTHRADAAQTAPADRPGLVRPADLRTAQPTTE